MGESGASAFLWQVPEKSVSAALSLEVIDRLNLEVMEGFLALPKRGLEVGGLLLGSVRREGEAAHVVIDAFEPFECEHASGPSYLLRPEDRTRLKERVAGQGRVVGLYRSHTRADFAATPDDLELFAECLRDPAGVFLLIRPYRDRAAQAGFLIRESGEVRSLAPYLDFPFRSASLIARGYSEPPAAAAAAAASGSPAAAAAMAPDPEPEPEPMQPNPVPRRRWLRKQEWLAAAAIAAIAVVAKVHGNVAPIVKPAPPTPRTAVQQPMAPIAPVQVASVSPFPIVPAPERPPARETVVSPPVAPVRRPLSSGTRDRVETVRHAPPMTELPAEPLSASVHTPDPPAPPFAAVLPAARMPAAPAPILATRHVAEQPLVSVAVDPVAPEEPRAGMLQRLHLGARPHPLPDFTPPRPIHQATAELSPELRRSIKHQSPVDVKVYIDRTGKVKYAELLSDGTGDNRDLASLAVFTSRRWQFTPARLEGETVDAEVILHYRFVPEGK